MLTARNLEDGHGSVDVVKDLPHLAAVLALR